MQDILIEAEAFFEDQRIEPGARGAVGPPKDIKVPSSAFVYLGTETGTQLNGVKDALKSGGFAP
jgi:hypothetical protein